MHRRGRGRRQERVVEDVSSDEDAEDFATYFTNADVPVLVTNAVVAAGLAGCAGTRKNPGKVGSRTKGTSSTVAVASTLAASAATASQRYELKRKWQSVRSTFKTGLEAGVDSDVEYWSGESDVASESDYQSSGQSVSDQEGSDSAADTESEASDNDENATPSRRVRKRRAKDAARTCIALSAGGITPSDAHKAAAVAAERQSPASGTPTQRRIIDADTAEDIDAVQGDGEGTPLRGKDLFGLHGLRRKKSTSKAAAVATRTPLKELVAAERLSATPTSAVRRTMRSQQAIAAATSTALATTPVSRYGMRRGHDATSDFPAKAKAKETPRTRAVRRRNIVTNTMNRLKDDASSSDSDQCLESELSESESDEEADAGANGDNDNAVGSTLLHRRSAEEDWTGVENGSDGDSEEERAKGERLGTVGRRGYQSYFQELNDQRAAGGNKSTSNNTLASLPTLDHKEYVEILAKLQCKHRGEKEQLMRHHRQQFVQWTFELTNGFNMLFYGYGSKRSLLNQFAKEQLAEQDVLFINGFFPTVNYREALGSVVKSVFPSVSGSGGSSVLEQAETLARLYECRKKRRDLYVIVHNIDGPSLRSDRVQMSLAILAASPRIHVIASIDHINAVLLWDTLKASLFNFCYHDVTTFEPYTSETTYENMGTAVSGVIQYEGTCAGIRGVVYVLNSLNKNTREVFEILAKHQIAAAKNRLADDGSDCDGGDMTMAGADDGLSGENDGSDSDDDRARGRKSRTTVASSKRTKAAKSRDAASYASAGMQYNALFNACRQRFISSNMTTFRAQLTEFLDHHIILEKKTPGTHLLYIPHSAEDLEQILEQV